MVVPGAVHHITQRGNNRLDVFFTDDDRRVYLDLLGKQGARFGLEVHGYCLMTNHVHLIATPRKAESLAKAVGRTNLLYSQYINQLHGRSGHLWQNRFYSCAMEEDRFWTALRYVEMNPVRAKLTRVAWTYEWSSAKAHVGLETSSRLLDLETWEQWTEEMDWKEYLKERDEEDLKRLRLNTRTGRPLGSDRFLSKVEAKLGRRVRALPHGRPRKRKDE